MKTKKVLLVDDEVEICEILAEFLTEENFFCLKAYNGLEAIETLKENPDIDLIVSDVSMPKIDGKEVLKFLRSEFSNKIPFIFTTALTDIADHEALDMGADAIFYKPIEFNFFYKELQRVLIPLRETIKTLNPKTFKINFDDKNWNIKKLGRRGLYLEIKNQKPKVGDYLYFQTDISEINRTIKGKGIFKWIHQNGAGVEYLEIDENSKSDFINFIENQAVTIPNK
jgi:CheY-like chemotaxis protein